ncbi:MAG: lytic transglycosylase domain-containing protein [Magnetococcales bacterium]|nr:lytic transglycosylase domain-containing protein [Magnetococcales bacterium]
MSYSSKFIPTLAIVALAVTVGHTDSDTEVTTAYRNLFQLLDSGQPIENTPVMDRSLWPRDQLLHSYLEFELLEHGNRTPKLAELRRFLQLWPDHAHAAKVRTLMDTHILEQGSDDEILAWLKQRPNRTPEMQGRYLELLLARALYQEAEPLWRSYYSHGHALSTKLEQLAQPLALRLTPEEHESRARVLLRRDRIEALHVVISKLPAARQRYWQVVEAAYLINPRFEDLYRALPAPQATSADLWQARLEGLLRQQPHTMAMQLLQSPEAQYIPEESRHKARLQLVRELLFQDKQEKNNSQARSLIELNVQERGSKWSDSLWYAGLIAHLQGDITTAGARFRTLATEGQTAHQRTQGAVWAARLMVGNDPQQQLLLEQAAHHPETLYGMLALEKQRGEVVWPAMTSAVPCPDLMRQPETIHRELRRMRLLRDVGRGYHNGAEVDKLGRSYGISKRELVCLALEFQAPNQATRIAESLLTEGGEPMWRGLYPTPNWLPSQGWLLDPALIWAVTRQESRFSQRVISSAGAMGLMQLMPATAREEAKKLGLPLATAINLKQIPYNLSLGQSYLHRMLQQFDGDMVLAVAAYNAGPGRSRQWQQERRNTDPLLFIETIPISETRGYVQKVLHNYAVYRTMAQGSGSLEKALRLTGPGMEQLVVSQK